MTDEKVYSALNQLMAACGLQGESGSEALLDLLEEAVGNVDRDIIEQSHADGLCYDVNWLLVEALTEARPRHNDGRGPVQ